MIALYMQPGCDEQHALVTHAVEQRRSHLDALRLNSHVVSALQSPSDA